ncbi:MAG: tetratricopeptide repeat protein [Kouleothrix sp.]|jgi:tetratricopeptide (TPR) repeat protein|nr:tetratricopeptide repeat protein [Kouleothrix sp.]
MPPTTPSAGSNSPLTLETLQSLLAHHALDQLPAVERYLATLPWGDQVLCLGRALADYEDQRGWRSRATAHYAALLEQGKRDPLTFAILHYDLAELSHRWGDYDAMAQHLAMARRALAVLNDWPIKARDLRLAALLACERGDSTAAQDTAHQAVALATRHAHWPEQAAALVVLSYALVHAGQFAQAADCTGTVLKGDQSALPLKLRVGAIADYGFAIRRVQDDQTALPYYEQALEIHLQRRDPLELRIACANLGELYRKLGRFDDAEASINTGITALQQAGAIEYGSVLFNALGNIKANRDDHAAAVEIYQQALAAAQRQDNRQQLAVTANNLADTYLQLGKILESVTWRFCSGALAFDLGNRTEGERRIARVKQFVEHAYLNHKRALYTMIAKHTSELALPVQAIRALALECGLNPDDAERHPKVLTNLGLYFPLLDEQEMHSPQIDLLARSATLRRAARALPVTGADPLLRELAQVLDGEEILVLHPGLCQGYRVRISGIATNFQLHTLLAGAIMVDPAEEWQPGRRPDPRVVAAARDQPVDPAADTVHAAFGMASWQALQADGTLDGDFDTSAHMIANEGIPADIPLFGRQRILLLGPASYPRAWNAGRRFPKMRADLRVLEILSPEAVQLWLTRIIRAAV